MRLCVGVYIHTKSILSAAERKKSNSDDDADDEARNEILRKILEGSLNTLSKTYASNIIENVVLKIFSVHAWVAKHLFTRITPLSF